MERFYFRSIEAVWEMIAREEWLGCRHIVAHVRHTRVNTSVGSMYIIFLDFLTIKTYMYYVFKSIHVYSVIQKHWWSLTSSWPDEVQRMFSTAHEFSKEKSKPQTVL